MWAQISGRLKLRVKPWTWCLTLKSGLTLFKVTCVNPPPPHFSTVNELGVGQGPRLGPGWNHRHLTI
jgi:hypothetical protein